MSTTLSGRLDARAGKKADPDLPSSGNSSSDLPDTRKSATTGTTAASIRALLQQFISFYFRAPIKAFFRTRFDYSAYVRAVLTTKLPEELDIGKTPTPGSNGAETGGKIASGPGAATARSRDTLSSLYSSPGQTSGQNSWTYRLKTSTPVLLTHAVRKHGWTFLPNQVLPPLLANVFVGAVLYTSYLQSLSIFHGRELSQRRKDGSESAHSFPPSLVSRPSGPGNQPYTPPPTAKTVFYAGLTAGCIQTLGAAPLDALQLRFRLSDLQAVTHNGEPNMWLYAWGKLRSIGLAGIFAGFGLSALKDGLGYGIFFAAFEVTKTQAYLAFVNKLVYWKGISPFSSAETKRKSRRGQIQPHYLIEPTFLLLAGATATVSQQAIVHPLSRIQQVHLLQLETLDREAAAQRAAAVAAAAKAEAEASKKPMSSLASAHTGGLGSSDTNNRRRIWSSIAKTVSSAAEIAARPFDGRLHTMRLYYSAYATTFHDCSRLVYRLDEANKAHRDQQQPQPPSRSLSAQAHPYLTKYRLSISNRLSALVPSSISSLPMKVSSLRFNLQSHIKQSLPPSFPSSVPLPPLPAPVSTAVANTKHSVRAWHAWLYRGFWSSTIRQVPSSSAGLIIFEIFRRKHADDWFADPSADD